MADLDKLKQEFTSKLQNLTKEAEMLKFKIRIMLGKTGDCFRTVKII